MVSLLPAATDILLALGARALLVARTEADRQPELADLPSVGMVLAPSLEALAAARADLVVAWWGADLAAVRRVVARGGGHVHTPRLDRLADIAPAMRELGGLLHRGREADSVVAALEQALAEVGASVADRPRPRLLWVVSAEPLVAAGPETYIGDLLEVAGGRNALSDLDVDDAAWPPLALEAVLALAPDVLVWPTGPGMFPAEQLAARPGWSSLEAVRSGRVLVVDPDLHHVPGPRAAEAARSLARRLEELRLP
ncbi:MAG TPA: helical backbone metal receptor [Longimicrobiales bacterium]|nr:helical backbone metal receptor [Longimicrobiales bacterium]